MPTKKKPTKPPAKPSRAKPPAPRKPPVAAPKPSASFDEALDEPLLDVSGVFRAVRSVERTQRGGEDEKTFSDPSLVIEFQAKGGRDELADVQPGDSGSFDPEAVLDDAQRASRRKRLAELASQKRR